MAEFDKSLDKELFSKEVKFETTKIKVSVMSYNDAEPKIQLNRENLLPSTGEWRWNKLGRLKKEEVEALIPKIQEALDEI